MSLLIICVKNSLPALFMLLPFQILFLRINSDNFHISFLYIILITLLVLFDIKNKNKISLIKFGNGFSKKNINYFYFILFILIFFIGLNGQVASNKSGDSSQYLNLILIFFDLWFLLVFVYLYKHQVSFKYFIILVIFVSLIGLILNSRGLLIKLLLLLFFSQYLSRYKFDKWLLLKLFTSIIFISYLTIFIISETLKRKGISLDYTQISFGLELLINQFIDVKGNQVNPSKILYFYDFTNMSNYRLDSIYIFAFLYGMVPSLFWSGKPIVSIGQPIGEQVFGATFGAAGGGVPTDVVGQIILTYGNEFIYFGFFMMLVIQFFISRFFKYNSAIGILLYFSFSNLYGSDFARMFISFMYLLLMYKIYRLLIKIKWNK